MIEILKTQLQEAIDNKQEPTFLLHSNELKKLGYLVKINEDGCLDCHFEGIISEDQADFERYVKSVYETLTKNIPEKEPEPETPPTIHDTESRYEHKLLAIVVTVLIVIGVIMLIKYSGTVSANSPLWQVPEDWGRV